MTFGGTSPYFNSRRVFDCIAHSKYAIPSIRKYPSSICNTSRLTPTHNIRSFYYTISSKGIDQLVTLPLTPYTKDINLKARKRNV